MYFLRKEKEKALLGRAVKYIVEFLKAKAKQFVLFRLLWLKLIKSL